MENSKSKQEVIIRPAHTEDGSAICEIYSQHFGHTELAIRQWWNIMQDEHITYHVAEIEGRVVGVATLITINKLIRSGNRMGLIEDVAVDNNYRGYGIGRLLIESLQEQAVKRNCYKTILNCSEENIGFYEKCGFYQKEVQMRWDRPAKDVL